MTATRRVYLITSKVAHVRDHWGLYFPSTESYGKVLHVVGAPQFGFKYEVKHHWNIDLDSKTSFTLHLLGETDATNIIDAPATDEAVNDLNKADKFENVAMEHPPPRVSPELIPKGAPSVVVRALQRAIPGMRRCQEWTSDFIDDLVKGRLLPESALTVRDDVKAARMSSEE